VQLSANGVVAAIALCSLGIGPLMAQVPPAPRDRVIWVGAEKPFGLQSFKSPPAGDLTGVTCPRDCSIEIKVWVDPLGDDPSGRKCAFQAPFVVVLKKKNAKVTWKLVEVGSTQNARFSDKAGADDGIRIYQSMPHFKNRAFGNTNSGWERDDDTGDGARVLLYDINVEHDLGGKKCDVPDPIIVNRD